MRSIWLIAALLVLILMGLACAVTALDTAEGRKVVQAHDGAVVTIELVLETTSSYEGTSDKEQRKVSTTGTVIDPGGLVVTSLTELNPSEMYTRLMADDEGFRTSSRTVDAKIKLPDGTEIPADFVLRDRDLDLAFLRRRIAPAKPMTYVDLANSGEPEMLDEVMVLSRLGLAASKSLGVTTDRIRAVVTKPRTFYLLNPSAHSNLGGPGFMQDGKVVGISVLRYSVSKSTDRRSRGGMDDMISVIILPAATVSNAAEQAKKAAPIKESSGDTAAPAKTEPAKPAPKKPTPKGK